MLLQEHEALHDPLTGLGNRALLAASRGLLAHGRGRTTGDSVTALLLLDLDGFKTVNDTLGHAVGDQLLVEVAQTLRKTLHPDDVVTRLGGDEFAVLLRDLPSIEAALRVARTVSDALHRPFVVNKVALEVGVSIGVSANDTGDLEGMLRRADVAMYQAKREGGGARLYDNHDDPHDATKLGLLSHLRGAIDNDELRLHFQPKVALLRRHCAGQRPQGPVRAVSGRIRRRHPGPGTQAGDARSGRRGGPGRGPRS